MSIAATNADVERAMKAEQFREDLYCRPAVMWASLQPLRDRGEDITNSRRVPGALYVVEREKNVRNFGADTIAVMQAHDWPGNTRELILGTLAQHHGTMTGTAPTSKSAARRSTS